MKNIELYFLFLKLQIKQVLEYKSDFLIGVLSVLMNQVNIFLLTIAVFMQIDTLAGYSVFEIFLMYGFFVMVKGIDLFYNDNIWNFAWSKIKDGSFMTMLLRPINPIFYIVMERININGVGEVFIGFLIIVVSLNRLKIYLHIIDILLLFILVICGLIVYFSFKLLYSAPAFWTKTCGEFMTVGLQVSDVAKYPLELYKNKAIKTLLLYIMPFPITSYLPSLYCIQKIRKVTLPFHASLLNSACFIPYAAGISIFLLIISLIVWYRGLKRYEPTGT